MPPPLRWRRRSPSTGEGSFTRISTSSSSVAILEQRRFLDHILALLRKRAKGVGARRMGGALVSGDLEIDFERLCDEFVDLSGLPEQLRSETYPPANIFRLRRNLIEFYDLLTSLAEPVTPFEFFFDIVDNRELNPLVSHL